MGALQLRPPPRPSPGTMGRVRESVLESPASSLLSFFLLAPSPSPSAPAQKLSVHCHFLWLLSLSPDLMRTIWGKEGGREGGGEAARPAPPATISLRSRSVQAVGTLCPKLPLSGPRGLGCGALRGGPSPELEVQRDVCAQELLG